MYFHVSSLRKLDCKIESPYHLPASKILTPSRVAHPPSPSVLKGVSYENGPRNNKYLWILNLKF